MELIKKQQIQRALRTYCERYESQNKAANTMKGVSSATVSQILNENWDLITDAMWRNVATQIGYKENRWEAVETNNYRQMMMLLADVKENSLVMAITGEAGSGKTFAATQYTAKNKGSYMLCCNEYWNRKVFLTELLTSLGRDYTGYTVSEMMIEAVRALKTQDAPLLILDEADKLSDQVFYFFITLYNQLEDECGIVLLATDHLEKRIKRGIKLNKKGYNEIWSRLGRKCVQLKGVNAADIAAICEANGIVESRDVDIVVADSESDLRRVKRKVHALTKKRTLKS
ncbi:MAG: ATP-binding protein [Paludibacteraceae bacterium]|nr:ATP-binding protein [Paludibacteraceae bacterium]